MNSTNNEFILNLLALLDKQKSKSQINANIKELEQSIRKIKLTATLAKGNTKSELNQVIRQLESQLKQIKVQAKIDSRQLNREINNALRNVSARDININLNNTGDRLNAQVRRAVSQAREYVNRNPISVNIDLKREKLLNQLAAFTNKHTKINESSYWLGEAERIRGVIEAVSNRNELRDATDQFQVFTTGVRATGYAAVSTTDRIKGMLGNIVKVGNYFGLAFVAVNKFRQSLNTLKENDTILVEISKTSEMTKQQLKELGDEAFNVASKYGQVSGNYLTAVQEMARSGYEMMSKELGELSLLAQSAGDMTADMANNYLLATDAAYKYGGSVEKLNAALDGANYISNKNSASLTDLADATRVSASFAANANVAIDELTAAEATMIATTKRSGSEMGRAFRSILLNLQQVSGEFDGEEINEEQLKKVEERCHSLGVELEYMKDGVATLRNPMEVLKDLAEVYNSLPDNSADKQGLISDLGGKYHANALSALLSRWDLYEKMLGEFSQGTGSALEEANKTADSWAGRLAQLQNSWDSFVNSLTNKGAIKGGVSFLDNTIQAFEKLTDTLGAIPVLLTTINGSMSALNKNYGITQIYNKDAHKFDLQGNFMGIDITAYKTQAKHFREAAVAMEEWNNRLVNGTANINTFDDATVQNAEHLRAYLQTTSTEAPASLAGYRAYLNAAGVSTDTLRLKTVLMTSALTFGLTFAIQGAVTIISKLVNAQNEAVRSAQEAAKTYGESSSSINDYISRYKELQEALKSAKGNEQETYNVKKQLLELQTEINEKFSEAHGAVNLLTGDYESCTAAIQNLNKEAAQTFLNENMKGIRKAEEQMQKERHYVLDYSEHLGTEKGDAIKEIAEKYKDRGIYLHDETGDGSYAQFSVNIKADAQSAYETINDFQNELREKAKELGKEDLFSGIINISSSAINETKKVIDDYGDIFNQALTAEIASDDDKAVKYNEALEAVNAFNEAVLQSEDVYNDKNVDNARQSLREIKEELESSEEWEKYSSLIDDVFEQADTKLIDFNNHIKNDDSARKLAEDLEGLYDLNLKAFDENIGENKSFDKLKESAYSYGLGIEELIDTLVRLGYVQGEISNQEQSPYALSIDEAKKAVNGTDNVIGLIEEYQFLQEVLSDTGNIQEETYEKLLSCSAKYATAIRTENGRITVNTSKLKAVAKSRQLDTKEAIKQTLALKKQEWVQWNNDIENYNGTLLDSITANYENIDSLQQQITQYELLVNSVDEASNAFKRFEAAQSVDEQDMFTTAQDAFNLVNETLNKADSENYGKTNTKKFQLGIELLADDEDYKKLLNAESMEDYVRISKEIVKTLSPLFAENEGTGVDNLFKRADAIIDSGDIPKNDKEWADRLDTSVEIFQALKQRANLYEYNNREYFSSGFTNKLDEYQSRLSNVRSAQEALNECTDTTSHEYMRLSKELDDAKQKYNEFKNETADTIESAYADFTHSGAKSKGSFSDYLKQSMGMEDSDITGMIDVLLDKSKSLQENLANMHPDSAAYELYKKQLDDVNSLLASLDFDIDSIDKTKSLEDKISQYKELVEEAKGYKKTLETEDSGSDAYKEAEQELERISELMAELREPLRLEINSNISEIDSQIAQLDEKLKGLNESLKHASSSNEAYAIHMDIKGAENEKAKLEGQKAELQETVKLIVDSTEIDEFNPEEKEGTVKYSPDFTEVTNATPPVLKGEVEYEAKMPGQPTTPASQKPKQAEADGTFHAFAQGTGSDVSIPKDEKALVNELGEEGLVRNGKLIPIRGGAQFINLKRGDIVFNHKEMEQLKKHGYTTGRGKLIGAHAEGTVNAYAGTDTYTKYNRGNVLLDWKSNPANPKNNPKKAAKEAAEEKAEEEKEAFEEIFDWIDRRIKNFQRKFDKWLNQAETALTSGFITKYYKKAAKSLSKELKTYGKAYNRYMKEANSSRLSKRYKKKVKNGTIDIENIKDEKLADKIKKYQEYYDKATDSTTSFVETAEKLYNLPLDKAAAKIEKFSDAIDLLDKKLDNAIGSKAKNRLVDQQTIQKKNTLDANAAAAKETQNNLAKAGANLLKANTLKNSGVSAKEKKAIKNAVKNGTEINLAYFKEGSNGYNAAVKYNEALKASAQAVYDLQTAQEEYTSWLVESAKIKFDNIADDYEKQIQMIGYQMTDLENKMSEIETRGKKVNKSYYESQRSINIQTIDQLKKERAELEQSLKGIKQGTDEWYDAYDKIKQIDSDISGKIRDNYDNVNKINQLYFDLFEGISESIGRIITEQEFLQGLFAHEKLSDNKTGNLTEAGLAKLGSLSASYYASKNNAERDTAALKELLEVRDKGKQADGSYQFGNWEFNSLEDLEDRIDEFYTKTQNDIKEEYRLKSEIADLMKEKYQAELDMLKELIDSKKEALNAEKDLHDYQKTLQEKTDSISTIKKQIAAYSGDTSEEGRAKLQKLRKDLAEKQDDLKETEYDRYISDQQDMLDKLYEEYEELVTKKLEDFMTLVEEGLALADKNTAAIYDFLKGTADTNGYLEETKGLFDGLSGTIKDNVDRIIGEMAKKKTDESGTEPEQPSGAQSAAPASPPTSNGTSGTASNSLPPSWVSSGTPSWEGSLVQYDPNTSQGSTVVELNNKSYRENAKRFIKNNARPAQKARNKYSAVNKKIYDNASNSYSGKGKVLSENDLKLLAGQMNVTYDGAGEKKNLYQKLKAIKFPGFKKGGVVSVDDIEKQVKQNGDDGIASVKNGESILTPVQTDLFKKFTEHMPELTAAVDMGSLVKIENPIEHLRDLSNARSTNNVVNIDNITLPNVTNAEEFADTLIPVFQRKKGFEKLVKSMSIESLESAGRLNKYRNKF